MVISVFGVFCKVGFRACNVFSWDNSIPTGKKGLVYPHHKKKTKTKISNINISVYNVFVACAEILTKL